MVSSNVLNKLISKPSCQITKPSQLQEMKGRMKKHCYERLSFDPWMSHAKDLKKKKTSWLCSHHEKRWIVSKLL